MKYIVFGEMDSNMEAVLNNIPFEIEYLISNRAGCGQFQGKPVFTPVKVLEENKDDIYIFAADMENYPVISQQLVSLGLVEGRHFSGAVEYLYQQWEKNEYFDDLFAVRVYEMAQLIADDSTSVMDLGCGEQKLRDFLCGDITYIGVDYVERAGGGVWLSWILIKCSTLHSMPTRSFVPAA